MHLSQTPLMGLARIFAVFLLLGLCLNAKEFWCAGARLRGLEEREVGWERGMAVERTFKLKEAGLGEN